MASMELNLHCPQCNNTCEVVLTSRFVKLLAASLPPSNAEAEDSQHPDVLENGSSMHPKAANVKNRVNGSLEKNQTLLSVATELNTMAPSSCGVMGGKNCNDCATKPVFKVKRKSKNGEALQFSLSLSDISPFFGLHLSNAAKKLGISMTSLKKACRYFGLHRWPGRKVRGLESTIDGLKRSIGGQGTDLESSEESSMRYEIPKLQQELHDLYHGTPAQITEKMHSPAVITKDACKRLCNVHDWHSEHHNPVRHDINAGNQPNITSGLAPVSARENSMGADLVAKSKKQPERKQKLAPCTDVDPTANQPTPNADKESAHPSPRKCIGRRPRRILRSSSRLGSRDTEMKASDPEGLLPEVHDIINVARREVPESVVQSQNGNNMTLGEVLLKRKLQSSSMTSNTEIGEGTGDGNVSVEEAGATVAERSAKRPKLKIRGGKSGKSI